MNYRLYIAKIVRVAKLTHLQQLNYLRLYIAKLDTIGACLCVCLYIAKIVRVAKPNLSVLIDTKCLYIAKIVRVAKPFTT